MTLMRKSYQKILLLFWCGLVGLSTGVKVTYATARPFLRMTRTFSKKYYSPLCHRHTYPQYVGRGSSSRRWHLSGYYRGGYNYSRVTWPYTPYAAFTTQSVQTVACPKSSIKSTLEALRSAKDGEALLQLVQQMACLDAQPIPLSFVLLTLGKEEEQTRHILLTLEKHGLIKRDAHNVYMDGIIQTIIGDLYPLTSEQVKNLVVRYVDYNIDKVALESYSTANLGHQMLPHGKKLLKYVQKQRGEDVYTAKCYLKLSSLYHQQGNYQTALTLGEKAIELFEQVHGKNTPHSDIALSYNNLGSIYYDQRLYDKAIKYYKNYLNMYKKVGNYVFY